MLLLFEKIYIFTSFAFFCLILSLYAYWAVLQPDNVISDIRPPEVLNKEATVEVGQLLHVKRYFCINNHNIFGTALLHRAFSNHIVYSLPDINNYFKNISGCTYRIASIEVPTVLPSGTYTYDVKVEYKLNPIRTILRDLPGVEVNIINPAWDRLKELESKK